MFFGVRLYCIAEDGVAMRKKKAHPLTLTPPPKKKKTSHSSVCLSKNLSPPPPPPPPPRGNTKPPLFVMVVRRFGPLALLQSVCLSVCQSVVSLSVCLSNQNVQGHRTGSSDTLRCLIASKVLYRLLLREGLRIYALHCP